MKRTNLLFILLALLLSSNISYADTMPKHELRSAWVATVWALDWPKTSTIAERKAELTTMLDYYKSANMNAVSFQVRGRCDAMYNSKYEPWSSDLGAGRGTNPGWDPLAFLIDECHKRGMELHAWVNPLRYETSKGAWTRSTDYRQAHPDWLLDTTIDGSFMSILNPGVDEARAQIVLVCKDIIENYNIDGLMFDDYFYANGTPSDADYDLYLLKRSSSSQSQGDWRRENINTMVRDVYNMIQGIKPYVKFGISPAGVAGTIKSVTDKYGVDQLTSISSTDWQYDGIYSDPLAWISEGTVDFISPQIYWATTHATAPFKPICEWWANVAKKFGRHFYTSHSHSAISEWNEYATEVNYARSVCSSNANGSVFYSAKYLYNTSPGTSSTPAWIAANINTKPALSPAITWKTATDPGKVSNIAFDGTTLSWSGFANMRYSIYAIPNDVDTEGATDTADYLLGVSYDESYTLPEAYRTGYKYGVAVYDRYSNEYDVTIYGNSAESTSLLAPITGSVATTTNDLSMSWQSVDGVSYKVQLSSTPDFKNVIAEYATTNTSCMLSNLVDAKKATTYFWRVLTIEDGMTDGVSDSRTITTPTSYLEPNHEYVIVKDPVAYSPVNMTTIENLWIQSNNTGNKPSLDANNRGFAYYNGMLYVSNRNGGASLISYDAITGESKSNIVLGSAVNTTSGGAALSYPANDVFTDNANNLCVSNMTLNLSTQPLTICVVNPETGAATRYFEYSNSDYSGCRIDYCTVYGDITKNAVVMAGFAQSSTSHTTDVIRWNIVNGVVQSPQVITLESYYPSDISNNGIAPRIKIIDNDLFVYDSSKSYATLYYSDGSLADSFSSKTSLSPNGAQGAGVDIFKFYDKDFMVYSAGDNSTSYTFNIVSTDDTYNYSEMSKYWSIPEGGLGNNTNSVISALACSAPESLYTQLLWTYVPSNGIAGYRMSYGIPVGTEAVKLQSSPALWLSGDVIKASYTMERISVYNVSGVLVKDKTFTSTIDAPDASGVYIVKALYAGTEYVARIIR